MATKQVLFCYNFVSLDGMKTGFGNVECTLAEHTIEEIRSLEKQIAERIGDSQVVCMNIIPLVDAGVVIDMEA